MNVFERASRNLIRDDAPVSASMRPWLAGVILLSIPALGALLAVLGVRLWGLDQRVLAVWIGLCAIYFAYAMLRQVLTGRTEGAAGKGYEWRLAVAGVVTALALLLEFVW